MVTFHSGKLLRMLNIIMNPTIVLAMMIMMILTRTLFMHTTHPIVNERR